MPEVSELVAALEKLVEVVNITHDYWDKDQDAKVGKLLAAMGGHLPKYRADLDSVHEILRRARQHGALPDA